MYCNAYNNHHNLRMFMKKITWMLFSLLLAVLIESIQNKKSPPNKLCTKHVQENGC